LFSRIALEVRGVRINYHHEHRHRCSCRTAVGDVMEEWQADFHLPTDADCETYEFHLL
jgi:hypothetical protein